MKKIILVAALVLGFAAAAAAQPRAVGLRGGWGVEASYQHTLSASNFIEADLGLWGNGFNAAGIYNFMLAQPQWTDRGEWGFYAGPGVALGVAGGFHVAVAGQVGLEYTFWFPLQLSIDIRPQFGLGVGHGAAWFHHGGYYPSVSARYKF